MFHVGMWRERFRDALTNIRDGQDYQRPPANADEINDAELPKGIGTPLNDAAARADHLLTEIIELYETVGDVPMEWNISRTTTEAALRNSCVHAQLHMVQYYRENGLDELGHQLAESAAADMRAAGAPSSVMGAVLYNLACARAHQGRTGEAIALLTEAFPLRPDIKQAAPNDADLGEVREDPRFKELLET